MKIKFITKLISAVCAATMATSAVAMPVGAITLDEGLQMKSNNRLFDRFQGQAYYAGINDPNYLNKILYNLNMADQFESDLLDIVDMIDSLEAEIVAINNRVTREERERLAEHLEKFIDRHFKVLGYAYFLRANQELKDQSLKIWNIARQFRAPNSRRPFNKLSRVLNDMRNDARVVLSRDFTHSDLAIRALSEYMEAKDAIDLFYDWQAKEVAEKLDKDEEAAELDGIAWQIEEDEKTKKEQYDKKLAEQEQIAEYEKIANQFGIEEQIRQEVAEQYGIEEQIKEDEKTKKEQAKADEETKKEVQIARDEEFAIEAQLNELGSSAANYSSYEEAKSAAAAAQKLIMDQIEKDRSKALLNQVRGGVERRIASDNNDSRISSDNDDEEGWNLLN